jgi:hypothetical protein
MNSQEKAQLQDFLTSLTAAQVENKLPDADRLIREAVSRQPDAAYLLVQRCMLLQQGIAQAKARIAELEESPASSRSFLSEGNLAGTPRNSAPSPYAPSPMSASPYGAPAASGSGAGSFLGQAAATAAGVAGGAFLFEGLEHLFGHQQPAFGTQGFLPTSNENVTVNNYYDAPNARQTDFDDDDNADSNDDSTADDDAGFNDDSASDSGSDWT